MRRRCRWQMVVWDAIPRQKNRGVSSTTRWISVARRVVVGTFDLVVCCAGGFLRGTQSLARLVVSVLSSNVHATAAHCSRWSRS